MPGYSWMWLAVINPKHARPASLEKQGFADFLKNFVILFQKKLAFFFFLSKIITVRSEQPSIQRAGTDRRTPHRMAEKPGSLK